MSRALHFYENGWCRAPDDEILRYLSSFRLLLYREPDQLPTHIVEIIQNRVNEYFNSEYPASTVIAQMKMMKERYICFSAILAHPRVAWNPEFNWLDFADSDREEIKQLHPLAVAYVDDKKGETRWTLLEKCFRSAADDVPRCTQEADPGDSEVSSDNDTSRDKT